MSPLDILLFFDDEDEDEDEEPPQPPLNMARLSAAVSSAMPKNFLLLLPVI